MAKKKSPRRTSVNWSDKPFAVATDSSAKFAQRFGTLEEALEYVRKLPLDRQAHAYIGKFRPVVVKSSVFFDE